MYAIIGVVVIIVVVVLGLYFTGYLTGTKTAQVSIVDDNVCTNGSANCKFTPSSYSTTTGSTVTWKNNGMLTHTVTFTGANVPSPSDQTVSAGQSVSVTISSPGTYQYYCTIHSWMKGNVTVT